MRRWAAAVALLLALILFALWGGWRPEERGPGRPSFSPGREMLERAAGGGGEIPVAAANPELPDFLSPEEERRLGERPGRTARPWAAELNQLFDAEDYPALERRIEELRDAAGAERLAWRHFNRSRPDRALEWFDQALEWGAKEFSGEERGVALFGYGLSAWRLGEYEAALGRIGEEDSHPDMEGLRQACRIGLGRKFFQEKNFAAALPLLETVFRSGGMSAQDEFLLLGRCYFELGKWEEARLVFAGIRSCPEADDWWARTEMEAGRDAAP